MYDEGVDVLIHMQKTIKRYRKQEKVEQITNNVEAEQYMQQLKHEAAIMAKKIELLEASQRRILGNDLDSCSIEELHQISSKLEQSLRIIRERKCQLFKEKIQQLKAKESFLLEENAKLQIECGERPRQQYLVEKGGGSGAAITYRSSMMSSGSSSRSCQIMISSDQVETGLCIGQPVTRTPAV